MTEQIHDLSFVTHNGRQIPQVPTELDWSDRLGYFKARWAIGRMKYMVEPGLYAVGKPGADSPVFVSANYKMSFDRLRSQLAGRDGWILVLDTKGINVWCAACGGELTTQSVSGAVKITRIANKVSHRRLVLPQFSAPGIDIRQLKQETGFNSVFGPAYAKDIPKFLKMNGEKTSDMCLAKYPLSFRLEMLLSMNALIWAFIAAFSLMINPGSLFVFSLLFWGAGIVLYAGYPWIPGNVGLRVWD